MKIGLIVSLFVMVGCTSMPSGTARTPSSLSDDAIKAATRRADVALCRDFVPNYSIADRQDMLKESIGAIRKALTDLSGSARDRAQDQLDELMAYQTKSETSRYFWDVVSTCPRQLIYLRTKIDPSPNGQLDAFERAMSYKNIGLCTYGRGRYAIGDRQDFLVASMTIVSLLANNPGELSEPATRELRALEKIVPRAAGMGFWDVGSTCPR